MTIISYGQLMQVLVCTLPVHACFEQYGGKTHLLAVVTPCQTHGKDAQKEVVRYSLPLLKPVVIDVRAIKALVGRVESRGSWGIIDQFDACALPKFVAKDEEVGEFGEEDD